MNSWKTTLSGVLLAFGSLIPLLTACLEGNCNWSAILTGLMAVGGAFGIGAFARDNDKSSEQVGTK